MSFIPAASIPRTSVAGPEEKGPPVGVQFLRWTAFGQTAYQKGQYAGFTEEQAQRLVKQGAAVIVSRQ